MAARARPQFVAGLDIGTNKVCCFIAELDEFYAPRLVGYGQHAAHGMKKGQIVDMDRMENAVREAVNQAEEMADVRISEVYVSLGGMHLRSHTTDGLVMLGNHEISDDDIAKVLEVARGKHADADRVIISTNAVKYLLDGQSDIRDPRGMTGSRLEAEVHVVSAPAMAVRNMTRCVERCNLDVAELVVQPYASALSCLVQDERELGVCLVDIGGGTCDISMFVEGTLVHTAVVPVGGQHVTSDIARGLSTPLTHAERIKTLYGCAMGSLVSGDDRIDIPRVGDDEETAAAHITRGALAGIIQPRCEEMLELVKERIDSSGFESSIGRRVVLTGGGSQLYGLRQLAEAVLDKTVRLARPAGLDGLTDLSGGPQYATVAGLVIHGAKEAAAKQKAKAGEGGKVADFLSLFNRWFRESFQTI